MWQHWINAVLGVVVLCVAAFGGIGLTAGWILGVLGGVIAILGFWGAGSLVAATDSTVKHA